MIDLHSLFQIRQGLLLAGLLCAVLPLLFSSVRGRARITAVLVALSLCWFVLAIAELTVLHESTTVFEKWVSWIADKRAADALSISWVIDGLSSGVLLAIGATLALLVLSLKDNETEAKPERLASAMVLGAGAVALAALSNSATAFVLALCLLWFSQLLSFGSRWDQSSEADALGRLLRDSWGALAFTLVGAVAMATQGGATRLGTGAPVSWVGAFFVGSGAVLLLRPLFLSSWVSRMGGFEPLLPKLAVLVWFPAWVANLMLCRSAGVIHEAGLSELFSIVLLAAAAINAWAAALELGTAPGVVRMTLAGWLLNAAILVGCTDAVGSAREMLSAQLISGGLLVTAGSWTLANALKAVTSTAESLRKRAGWWRMGAVMAAAGLVFSPGFPGLGYFGAWSAALVQEPWPHALKVLGAAWVGAMWLVSVQSTKRASDCVQVGWPSVVAPLLLTLVASSALLTGDLFGLASLGMSWDESWSGALRAASGFAAHSFFQTEDQKSAALTGAAACVGLTLTLGFWMGRNRGQMWRDFSSRSPRALMMARKGFGSQVVGEWLERALIPWSTRVLETAERLNARFGVAALTRKGLDFCSDGLSRLDRQYRELFDRFFRGGVSAPGQALQVFQTGDARWSMFFGVGVFVLVLLNLLLRGSG